MEPIELTQLIHDDDLTEPLKAYFFNPQGYHPGPMWFRKKPQDADEYSAVKIKQLVDLALRAGAEVRITNGGDFLVFHARDGVVLYPDDPDKFWKATGGA